MLKRNQDRESRDIQSRYAHFSGGIFVCLLVMLSACTLSQEPPIAALATRSLPTAVVMIEPSPDVAGWTVIAPGLETRTLNNGDLLGQLNVVRIDPARFAFRAHYRPGEPLGLNGWRDILSDAVTIINANFFDPSLLAQGLLVVDGVTYGQSFVNRGGMFTVIGNAVRVRSTIREPYQGEALDQAIQAFPMLVEDGLAIPRSERGDRRTRRSAIAQDQQGRILLLATPLLGLTLADLSMALTQPELAIEIAFNLDGGGSTMLYARTAFSLVSLDAVPAVLAAYPR